MPFHGRSRSESVFSPPFVLSGRFLDFPAPQTPRLRPGFVAVDEQGRIAQFGTGPVPHALPGPHHAWSGWVLPGLIDLHHHWPQWPIIGADGLTLLDWLEDVVYPAEEAFQDPQTAYQTSKMYATDMIRHGTTTAVGYSSSHPQALEPVLEACQEVGLSAVVGPSLMDRNCPEALRFSPDAVLPLLAELAVRVPQRSAGRLQVSVNPRFSITCSDKMLNQAGELARKMGLPVQTHLAEHVEECRMAHQLCPEARDYTDIYARAGLLGPQTLLAHGIHLTAEELDDIRRAGSTVVHCPTANVFLQSGTLGLQNLWRGNIRVGLGTDVGAGTTVSMPAVAVNALETAKHRKLAGVDPPDTPLPSAAEMWWLMTTGNAAALGAADRIGRIEPGQWADLLLVHRLPDDDRLQLPDLLSRLLYQWNNDLVAQTILAGRGNGW